MYIHTYMGEGQHARPPGRPSKQAMQCIPVTGTGTGTGTGGVPGPQALQPGAHVKHSIHGEWSLGGVGGHGNHHLHIGSLLRLIAQRGLRPRRVSARLICHKGMHVSADAAPGPLGLPNGRLNGSDPSFSRMRISGSSWSATASPMRREWRTSAWGCPASW